MQGSRTGLQDQTNVSTEGVLNAKWSFVTISLCAINLARCNFDDPILNKLRNSTDPLHLLHHINLVQDFLFSPENPMVFDDVFLVILLGQVAYTAATNEPLGGEDNLQDVVRVLIDTYFSDRL